MKIPSAKTMGYTLAAIVVASLWLFAGFELALWGTIAVVCVLFAVPVQVVGTAAMVLLLMVAGSQLAPSLAGYSEQLAVYVFYLLCIIVLLQARSLGEDGELEPLLPAGLTFTPKVLTDTPSYNLPWKTGLSVDVMDEIEERKPAVQPKSDRPTKTFNMDIVLK